MTNEELVPVNNQELTTWDFEQMKSELQTLVDSYTNIAYTEDSIKDAKKDKASLNKIKKQIEDARKAFKKKCMEPYDAVEPKIKELVEMVDRQTVLISEVVKEVEDREKAKKEQEIRAYYDVKATVFGSLADSLYPKILNPKWLNKSTNKAKYQEEMLEAIAKTKSDLDVIQTMNPLMKDELEAVYVETLSMEEVEKKLEEFEKIASKIPTVPVEQTETNKMPESNREIVSEDKLTDGEVMLKIFADKSQLSNLTDFMKAVGIKYEIL